MKKLLSIAAMCALAAAACQSVPPVPPSNRTVVGPKGSTQTEKAWGTITEHEGNAVLGPLSNMRR